MHIYTSYLAATDTTEDRTLDAFDDEGVLLIAEEEDSKILRSQIGDNPSQALLPAAELLRCADEL